MKTLCLRACQDRVPILWRIVRDAARNRVNPPEEGVYCGHAVRGRSIGLVLLSTLGLESFHPGNSFSTREVGVSPSRNHGCFACARYSIMPSASRYGDSRTPEYFAGRSEDRRVHRVGIGGVSWAREAALSEETVFRFERCRLDFLHRKTPSTGQRPGRTACPAVRPARQMTCRSRS